MRMKLFLPLLREDMHAVDLFPSISEGFFRANWELWLRAAGQDCVVCDHEIWLFFSCKLTAFGHSCSGLFVSSTSSTRSIKCLVYLIASPGPSFSPSQSSPLCDLNHFHGFRYHPCANDSHSYNSALTSFPDSFCKCTQGFSFPWLFCRHRKYTMSKTESSIPSCPQRAPPPFFTILINSIPSILVLKSETWESSTIPSPPLPRPLPSFFHPTFLQFSKFYPIPSISMDNSPVQAPFQSLPM